MPTLAEFSEGLTWTGVRDWFVLVLNRAQHSSVGSISHDQVQLDIAGCSPYGYRTGVGGGPSYRNATVRTPRHPTPRGRGSFCDVRHVVRFGLCGWAGYRRHRSASLRLGANRIDCP